MNKDNAEITKKLEKYEFLRKICDKQTMDAMNINKSINPVKFEKIESKIFEYFEKHKCLITFETYLKLIKNIHNDSEIHCIRKVNGYGLDDIDDI